jgi:hypothetical protein
MPESLANMLSVLTGRRRMPGDPLVDPPAAPVPAWMKWVSAVWIVNFAAFVLIAAYLGGDALNGYAKDGHYFLAMHGHTFEVSRGVFLYSKWHAISLIASLAILMPLSYVVKRRSAR